MTGGRGCSCLRGGGYIRFAEGGVAQPRHQPRTLAHSVLGLDPAASSVPVAAGGLWDLKMRSTSPSRVDISAVLKLGM